MRKLAIIVAILTFSFSVLAQQAPGSLSTSERKAARNKFHTAQVTCSEKTKEAKVEHPKDIKKEQKRIYITCMKSKGFIVLELPE